MEHAIIAAASAIGAALALGMAAIGAVIGDGLVPSKVPEGMALRVRTDTGIVGRDFPANYARNDNVFTSPGYSDADNRANITLGLGIGSVSIREIGD